MPTNDNEMTYSTKYHMYILDLEYLRSELGCDFIIRDGSETKAKDTMYKISRTIYQFIYSHTRYKRAMEYWLAKDDELRLIILQVLEEQARYEFETNAEYLAIQSGINVLNGIVIPLNKIRGLVRIAPAAEEILRNKHLLYQGQRIMTKNSYDYEEDGY